MPLFGPAPFEKEVELATNENNLTEDWSLILDICDKVINYSDGPKFCLRAIIRRLHHPVPLVAMQALILLDACVNNCGKKFHLEVCSQDFASEIRKLLAKVHPTVSCKIKELLKKWAEEEFKDDPELCLIPSFYYKLKSEGVEFPLHLLPQKSAKPYSTDPNVVNSQEEEDDIAKAIEMSLQDTGMYALPLSYSSECNDPITVTLNTPTLEPLKVRTLYDFEAAEENELTFKAGEIILVLDNSDSNWWKGSNHRGKGLFPANFVSFDLNAITDIIDKQDVSEQESEDSVVTLEVKIDEEKIDATINMLDEADPTGAIPDPDDMVSFEHDCYAMAPLIEEELQKIDKRLALLNQINNELMDSFDMFYKLSRDVLHSEYWNNHHPTNIFDTKKYHEQVNAILQVTRPAAAGEQSISHTVSVEEHALPSVPLNEQFISYPAASGGQVIAPPVSLSKQNILQPIFPLQFAGQRVSMAGQFISQTVQSQRQLSNQYASSEVQSVTKQISSDVQPELHLNTNKECSVLEHQKHLNYMQHYPQMMTHTSVPFPPALHLMQQPYPRFPYLNYSSTEHASIAESSVNSGARINTEIESTQSISELSTNNRVTSANQAIIYSLHPNDIALPLPKILPERTPTVSSISTTAVISDSNPDNVTAIEKCQMSLVPKVAVMESTHQQMQRNNATNILPKQSNNGMSIHLTQSYDQTKNNQVVESIAASNNTLSVGQCSKDSDISDNANQ